MDRDAPTFVPTSPADAVPPFSPEFVRVTGLGGLGLAAAAAVLAGVGGLVGDSASPVLNPVRLLLTFVGVITTGAAVSMRPDLWWAWGLGAATAACGAVGVPDSWDSYQTVFWVAAGVAAVGAAVCLASRPWRVVASIAAILFHFTGIFMSATSPPPRPWLNEQLYIRVYNPYLQFVYMRNAYQFYSPDPGPASLLVCLLKTEIGTDEATGRKQYQTQWVVVPKRPADVKDPLALSYYRRLSVTEQLARGNLGLVVPSEQFEKSEVSRRRHSRTMEYTNHPQLIAIPYQPNESIATQYQVPNPEVTRFVLPSYASHVILANTPDKETAGKTSVKVYRVQHQTLTVEQFTKKIPGTDYLRPYHPITYRPYFLGEYDARGNLMNPQEDFLYWVIPIVPRPPGPNDPVQKPYIDYLSAHALDMTPKEVLEADESKGKVFNWSQLK